MSEHTPEPWGVLSYDVFKAASYRDAKKVLFECSNDVIESGANARRIVACVNACAGIETETLEDKGGLAEIITAKRAEIAKLQEGMQSDQERLKIYGDEISKLRAENARLKNLDMENIAQASKLEAEIAKLRAEREAVLTRLKALEEIATAVEADIDCGRPLEYNVEHLRDELIRTRAALAEKGERRIEEAGQ